MSLAARVDAGTPPKDFQLPSPPGSKKRGKNPHHIARLLCSRRDELESHETRRADGCRRGITDQRRQTRAFSRFDDWPSERFNHYALRPWPLRHGPAALFDRAAASESVRAHAGDCGFRVGGGYTGPSGLRPSSVTLASPVTVTGGFCDLHPERSYEGAPRPSFVRIFGDVVTVTPSLACKDSSSDPRIHVRIASTCPPVRCCTFFFFWLILTFLFVRWLTHDVGSWRCCGCDDNWETKK
jgi:hypothetical protein